MKKIILIVILVFSSSSYAKEVLKVAFGDTLPPWVVKENSRGIIFDILTECLADIDIKIVPKYLPYSRRVRSYHSNEVDAVIDINQKTIDEYKLKGFNSDIAYSYINYAISLKEKDYNFTSMNDLLGVSLLSWQDAIVHLGGEYAEMAKQHKQYTETHDQNAQVKMLFSKRVDVIQMDLLIFKYYRKLNSKKKSFDVNQDIAIHKLFGESPNSIFFRSKKIRDLFNKNLKKIKENGTYEKILGSYTKF